MELPSQSGLCSPTYADSEDDDSPSRTQIRKSNKPLLEKKRRARINQSLEQLKGLVLDALKKDSARYSKLEKADILEMTVKHLRETQQRQMAAAMSVDPTVVTKYQNGFGECAQEVQRYLGSIDGLGSDVRMRLMQHLGNCINQMSPYSAMSPMFGVPCASPTQSLPGMSIRCGLPYGGLAMSSPESPTLPVSPASLYNTTDYPDAMFTPKSHIREQQPGRHENTENIAPLRPLSEKTNNIYQMNVSRNVLSRDCGDNNNNNVCPPAAKRQRLDIRQNINVPNSNRNNNLQNIIIHQNLLEQNIKSEPVWRPW